MAEPSAEFGFEQKVEGLQALYLAYRQHDPRDPSHNELADPNLFYSSGDYAVSRALADAKENVRLNIGLLGRSEYGVRGRELHKLDLRNDSDELSKERADLLAVMTGPTTKITREQRAEKIAGVLGLIRSGQPLALEEFEQFGRHQKVQPVALDLGRAAFAVFRNSHISSTVLTIQYDGWDTSVQSTFNDAAMSFDVRDLFSTPNGTSIRQRIAA